MPHLLFSIRAFFGGGLNCLGMPDGGEAISRRLILPQKMGGCVSAWCFITQYECLGKSYIALLPLKKTSTAQEVHIKLGFLARMETYCSKKETMKPMGVSYLAVQRK